VGAVQSQGGKVGNHKQVSFEPATEGAEVTRSGRLFQTRAAATGWQSVTKMNWNEVADEPRHLPPTKLVGKVCRCRPVKTLQAYTRTASPIVF